MFIALEIKTKKGVYLLKIIKQEPQQTNVWLYFLLGINFSNGKQLPVMSKSALIHHLGSNECNIFGHPPVCNWKERTVLTALSDNKKAVRSFGADSKT